MAYMKDKASGISRPHPESQERHAEEIPVSGDTASINDLQGDTDGGGAMEQQPQKPKEEDIHQQEINQIEQMKMSGGSILSGPPPDRLKTKRSTQTGYCSKSTKKREPETPVKQDKRFRLPQIHRTAQRGNETGVTSTGNSTTGARAGATG